MLGMMFAMAVASGVVACVGDDADSGRSEPNGPPPAPAATNPDAPPSEPASPVTNDPPKTPDVPKPACNVDKPFGAPKALSSLHSEYYDVFPRLTGDELTIVFARESAYGQKPGRDIYIAKRASTSVPFDPPVPVEGVNSDAHESDPSISNDGLTLYFTSTRLTGDHDLFVAKRTSTNDAFDTPEPVAELNSSPGNDRVPMVVRNGEEIWFSSNRANGQGSGDLYRALRVGNTWGPAENIVELNSPANDLAVAVSTDALTVYFSSTRPGSKGEDIWMAKRSSVDAAFGAPTNVSELNTDGFDGPGWLSPDGCRLYFHSSASTADYDLYVAEKPAE